MYRHPVHLTAVPSSQELLTVFRLAFRIALRRNKKRLEKLRRCGENFGGEGGVGKYKRVRSSTLDRHSVHDVYGADSVMRRGEFCVGEFKVALSSTFLMHFGIAHSMSMQQQLV